jgi:very-short-patch-repair endonuclease
VGHKRRTHAEVSALATAQHGVVAARQLQERGFSRKQIAAEAAGHRWRRQHRGVYAVGHEDLRWEGECMAAVLACAPAVASHWTAAWLWELLRSRPNGRFHLTAPSRRHRRREFVVHYAPLAEEDVAQAEGIPVTSPERTHLDVAARWPDALPGMLERSEKSNRFDLRKFESLLARTSGHAGHGPLARALAAYRPEPAFLRSKLEQRFRNLLRDSSLPLPSQNVNVGPYELDCYWPEHRLCVELDTYGTHGSRRSFEQDRIRERELRKLGITVERVTDLMLEREPQEVLAAVRRGLA